MTYKVWGRATSSNVQKVMWTLAELGLPVERFDVGGAFGGLNEESYLARNPHAKIPTLETPEGIVVWESNAVVRYLARKDAARRLWPATGQSEADAEMWAEWAHHAVASSVTSLFWALVRTPPSRRDQQAIDEASGFAAQGLKGAERQLAGRAFLVGDQLSIADIVFGHCLYRYYEMEVERPPLPNVEAYYARLRNHPPYVEHVMVDFSSLRASD